jgi:excisionase family DNA binding protein
LRIGKESHSLLECYTVRRVAKMLGCSIRTVYRLIERGELHPIKGGDTLQSMTRIPKNEVETYLQRHRR